MDLNIKGKRALVMGSSAGLGLGIAKSLIAEGAQVAICARDSKKLEHIKNEIHAHLAIPVDLSKPKSSIELIKNVNERWGGIDILVTNTGGPPQGFFADITTEQWQIGFQSLWLSATEAISQVIANMKENKWGRILLVTSVAAKEPMTRLTVSNGLRAGLLGVAKSLSLDVAPLGITVNALLPGYTRTERLKELKVDESQMISRIPAGRLGEPEELGALVAFLCSQQAAYITGQAIACDGGYLHGL